MAIKIISLAIFNGNNHVQNYWFELTYARTILATLPETIGLRKSRQVKTAKVCLNQERSKKKNVTQRASTLFLAPFLTYFACDFAIINNKKSF